MTQEILPTTVPDGDRTGGTKSKYVGLTVTRTSPLLVVIAYCLRLRELMTHSAWLYL